MCPKVNPKSWLVWGTWILMLYGALATAWLGYGLLGFALPPALVICAAIAGVASACYSAFLFAQAKGRDLWQSPLFLWMLAAQAVIAGAAVIILIADATPIIGGPSDPLGRGLTQALDVMLAVGVLLNLLMVLGQVALPSSNADARRAIDAMTHGKLGQIFWYGVVVGGSVVPLMLIGILSESGAAAGMIAAAILALSGLFCFDEVWIKAGQAPPLS